MKEMTREEVQRELRASVMAKALERGWDEQRTQEEIEKALADTDWVMECQKRIQVKRN